MKTLYLVRHAKAINPDGGIPDFERVLEKKGKADARRIAKKLKEQNIPLDLLVSSPAHRALETAHIFAKELGYPVQKILLKDSIYNAPTEEVLLKIVQEVDDRYKSIMLFGHNPSFNDFAAYLIKDFKEDLPTCGVVCIDFKKNSWKKILKGSGILKFFDFPTDKSKKLKPEEKVRKELETKIIEQIENVFKDIDLSAAKDLEKSVKKAGEKLVKKFLKIAEPYAIKESDRGEKI